MPGRPNRVEFARSDNYCRAARDDELDVMRSFSSHAERCSYCRDPYKVYLQGGTLCDRGHAYARDVGQYIYTKAGKAYSSLDKDKGDSRVQIEIPASCDSIRGLLKAIAEGLRVRSPRPVVSHDRTYPVSDRRPIERRDAYSTVEIAPRREGRPRDERRRETVYVPGRGSLYHLDEEERRQRYRKDGNVQIVIAEPRRNRR